MEWYYLADNKQEGPTNVETLKKLTQSGALKSSDYVWNETMGEKWARVADVPILGAVQATTGEAAQREEFARRIAERHAAEARARRGFQVMAVLVGLVLIGGIAAAVWWVKTEPHRRMGISSRTPVGAFAALDAYLTGVHQMEKVETNVCEGVVLDPSWQLVRYTNPRAPRGQHVSGQGTITMITDASRNLRAVHFAYHSPGGPRGPAGIVNESVVSLFSKEYWKAIGGIEVTVKDKDLIEKVRTSASHYGLEHIPKGSYSVVDTPRTRAIWIEYDMYGRFTTMYARIP
jgi:hypothetical protein